MNKKLLIGISSAAVALGFWACGSGTVEPMDPNTDDYVKARLETGSIPFETQVNDAKTKCALDPVCENEMAGAQGSAVVLSSSEEITSSESAPVSSSVVRSSSSVTQFSFSGPIGERSSSSEVVQPPIEQSSSSTPVATGLGSCAPASATTELGQAIAWKFTRGASLTNPQELMSAKYEWTFPGGTPATSTANTPSVTYSESGTKTATLKLTVSSGTEDITCSPLRVNGQPITGCKCLATIESPDVAKGQAATWNLTGCTSKANIIKYTWTNATADATGLEATAAVAEKNDAVTGVSVLVENDDSTAVTVTCPDAKAIDSRIPDYELTEQNTSIELPAGKVTVTMNLPASWHNGETSGTCTFQCDGTNQQITVKAGGVSGTNYSVQLKIPISSTINGYGLDVELSADAKCKVGW